MHHDTVASSDRRAASGTEQQAGPGVRVPPPVFYLLAFVIGLFLQARFPTSILAQPVVRYVGAALIVAGALFIVAAVPTMLRGHGTLSTAGPSAALVTSGPYRFTRNPMYLGLTLLYSGLTCMFAIVWALPLLIPLILYTHVRVILPEERYLDRAFGDAYRSYRARVRRWL